MESPGVYAVVTKVSVLKRGGDLVVILVAAGLSSFFEGFR